MINWNQSPEFITNAGISLNIYWQPEMYYYDKNLFSPSKSQNHSLGLSVMFSGQEFFLETGVEIEYLTKNNIYRDTKITNDLIGQYEQVDSVHFVEVWDPVSQCYITQPQYFTSLVSIYEQHVNETETEKNDTYMYLRLPVMIGFQKPIGKLSLEAKTGFVFHSLLYTSQLNKEYSNEDIQLVYAGQTLISFERSRQYWSFVFDIGASYQLSKNTKLFVTPSYRYMLSPLFSGNEPSRKSPYAFGMKTGLRYTF